MNESERVSHLIGDIYDAALDPALWPGVLEGCAGFVGGVASGLFMKDAVRKTHNNVFVWRYDPEYTKVYLEKYVQFDPFTTGQFFFDVGEPMCLADIMPRAEFEKSRFYKEWVRPQRWIDALGVTLEKSLTTYSVLSIIRHESDGVVDDEAKRRAKLIAPHVRGAVLISKVIDLHKIEAAALADTLDGLSAAMFLVDTGGHIMHANATAHVMLADGKILRGTAGKLIANKAQADRALHDAFLTADAGGLTAGIKDMTVSLGDHSGERWLAHVLPLTSGARRKAGVAYSAIAAVFAQKATIDLPHPIETIANTFKLTPAEMRVLMMIVEVGGVPEVASVLGVSEPTVKTHLQHIFDKTQVRRQADLVKLVVGYMGPLR